MISQHAGLFINAFYGWPALAVVDLPSGGLAYPLVTPVMRLRLRSTPDWVGVIAVFNGSPAGLAVGNPQQRDALGTNFDLASGAFVIGEVQYLKDQASGATAASQIGRRCTQDPRKRSQAAHQMVWQSMDGTGWRYPPLPR